MFSLVFYLQLVFFNIIHSLQQCSLVFLLWLQVVLLGNYALLNIEGCGYCRVEHNVYGLLRTRDMAMARYREYNIPAQWMLDSGIVGKVCH